jgi:Glycosyl hydrolase family 63 C-terminal domain
MSRPSEDLEERARKVLERNRRGSWTCPSSRLYPHQWLWDSCFVAIGLACYDARRAADELRALFRGQWRNGMLPHMIFSDDRADRRGRRMWKSKKRPLAPRDVDTSCITQPPLPAVAVWRVARALRPADRQRFLAEMYPKVVAYHRWLYDERDLRHTGLITLIHPWECGLDTTPPWMQSLRAMPMPWWIRLVLGLRLARLFRVLRTDTRHIPAAQRSSDDDGVRMLVLASRARKYRFELARMPRQGSVLIEDLPFNAMLVAANRSLAAIARELAQNLPSDLPEQFARTEGAVEQLWDEALGQYFSRNAITGALIRLPTVGTFLPLWGASSRNAERLLALLFDPHRFWPRFPIPSVPIDDGTFQVARYWSGPTWLNMNWIVIECLQTHDYADVADELRRRTVRLVEHGGFSEYFSALTGEGYGTDDFSWTAALTIDLLHQ